MNLLSGNKYKIILQDKNEEQEGILITETPEFIFLKLKSGYNIGIKKNKIKKTELIKEKEIQKQQNKKNKKSSEDIKNQKTQKQLPKILILHTGGTIASKVDYSTGAVTSRFTPEEILALYPELKKIANIDSRLISNIASDDMNFHHYNLIIKEIQNAIKYKNLKGVILTQGTDTLHYTAAALSFAIQHNPLPILIVGSQRSSDRPSSDASSNLLNAALFITKTDFKGVGVCMHKSTNDPESIIIQGTNARKMHSSRRDAFRPINAKPLATVNFETKEIYIDKKNKLYAYYFKKQENAEKTEIKTYKENIKIGMIKSRPGLTAEELKIYENFDGLVLEGTGLGHFPIGSFDKSTEHNKKILETIKKTAKQKIAVMTTQCIHGRVNLNVYSPGRQLKDAGVLGHNLNMTPETAYIKLAFLLSNHPKEQAKTLYETNLAGELTERQEEGEYAE